MIIEPNNSNSVQLLDKAKINDPKNVDDILDPQKKYINSLNTILNESNDIIKSLTELPKKNKLRCAECSCRLNITNNVVCNCGKTLCYTHRYHNTHKCDYDFKTKERENLAKLNPKVCADKIIKI